MAVNLKSYVRLLFWRTETERFNPLMYPFFATSLAYGIGFASQNAEGSSLYVAMLRLGDDFPLVWGGLLLSVSILNVYVIISRNTTVGAITAYAGFMCWLFASFGYLLEANWIVLFSVALPNMSFWTWYYFRVKLYQRLRKQHKVIGGQELVKRFDEHAPHVVE